MVDTSLSPEHLLVAVFIVLYLILISKCIGKYHKYIGGIKKVETHFKLKKITEEKYLSEVKQSSIKISKLKKNSYILFASLLFLNLILIFLLGFSLIPPLILFALMLLILILNYWMKGASVVGSLKNLPSTSDTRPL